MKKIIFLIIGVFLFSKQIIFTNLIENNISTENNEINVTESIENFNENFYTQNTKISFAIIINKQKFFKYLPSIINSINAYLIQKGIDFNVSVYNNDINISTLPQQYIVDIETNKTKILSFKDYNKTFFVPTFNKNDFNTTFYNVYFGGLNFKDQIEKISTFINDKLITISQNTLISKILFSYEKKIPFFKKNYNFPSIDYYDLKNSFIILNTDVSKSAQILSNITSKEIEPFLIFSPQLCYSPSIIFLTQQKDWKKLIITNSIINPPIIINDYTTLLNSNIKYNWINYASNVLINKIYNMQNNEDLFYMDDFHIYLFNHQIDYKTNLFKIENNSLVRVK